MRIWFNKTFSSIHSVIRNLRESDNNKNLRLIVSHNNPKVPGMALADEAFIEPDNLNEEEYLEWAIGFCKAHKVDLFWPGKAAILIAKNKQRFISYGTQVVLAADYDVLRLLNNKAAFYSDLNPDIAELPETIPVNSLKGFDSAFEKLTKKHNKLCVKPSVSVFGLGFRLIDTDRPIITHLLNGVEYQIPVNELRFSMGLVESFETLLVMEYLPGEEWSVDCAARNGRLWCAVQRKKSKQSGGGQVIDNNPQISGMVERLTKHYGLNGIFNIQFKDSANGPRLLEINARPSGGIGMACLSGANLAKIAIEAITKDCRPPELENTNIAYGLRVSEVNTPIILGYSQ